MIFAAGLLLAAATVVMLAVSRLGRRFVGLQETLEELRDDLLWLREHEGNAGSLVNPSTYPELF